MADVRVTSRDYGNMWTCVHVDITVKNKKTQKIFWGVWGWGGLNVILWKTLWVGLFYPPQVPSAPRRSPLRSPGLIVPHCDSSALWRTLSMTSQLKQKIIIISVMWQYHRNWKSKWRELSVIFAKLHSSKPTAPRGTVPRPICRSIFVSSLIATSLLSVAVGDYITQTRCMRTLGDVIGRKASQKTPPTNDDSVTCQLVSLLTLRKMSLGVIKS